MSKKKSNRSRLPWKKKNKRKSKQSVLPSKPSTTDISSYINDMRGLVDYVNARIDDVLSRNMRTTELDKFLRGNENRRFNISQLSDPSDIRETMTELRTVLSTLEDDRKAQLDTGLMEAEIYRHQFGGNHASIYSDESGTHIRHFNVNNVYDENGQIIRRAINPQLAAKAFAAYRRVEEIYAGYIGRQGQEMVFGSENLIILLYSFYENNPGADYDYESSHNTDDAVLFASNYLDSWIQDKLLELEGINYTFAQASDLITKWGY